MTNITVTHKNCNIRPNRNNNFNQFNKQTEKVKFNQTLNWDKLKRSTEAYEFSDKLKQSMIKNGQLAISTCVMEHGVKGLFVGPRINNNMCCATHSAWNKQGHYISWGHYYKLYALRWFVILIEKRIWLMRTLDQLTFRYCCTFVNQGKLWFLSMVVVFTKVNVLKFWSYEWKG